MNKIQDFWNASSSTIPEGKDPSAYAVEKEKLFPRHSIVCDLGSGSGADALYFAGHGHHVRLLDISDAALKRANTTAAKLGLLQAIEIQQCDLGSGKLSLATGVFDVVYSRLSLHYFAPATLAELFKEIHRILKPDGKAYLTLKSPDDVEGMAYLEETATKLQDGVFEDEGHLKTRFSVAQLTDILRDAGLSASDYAVSSYDENFSGRKDKVKSGKTAMLLNEIRIIKT